MSFTSFAIRTGRSTLLVGFMFDISARKRTEEKVMALQRELEDLSFKDGLTGVANRRRFDMLMETEWKSAQRGGLPLSLIMIDIDFFKQYNDHYGHVRGDECLRKVAQSLRTGATRPRDVLARYGGEEFALVLPETDGKGAAYVVERCREALAAERILHLKSSVAPMVTVSVGVGTIVPTRDDRIVDFIAEVDHGLYRAKQSGRNSVVPVATVRTPAGGGG